MARGIELATAYVSLAVETSDISKTIAEQLGGVEKKVAPKAGKSIGKAMAKGFEAEAPDLSRLEREFEDAQKRIVEAEKRATTEQENLARKIEVAQAKKAEAVERYGEKSSQALSANDRLILAEQKLEAAAMKAEAEQDRLNKALAEAEEKFTDAKNAAENLGDELEDAADAAKDGESRWGKFGDAVKNALSGDYQGAFSSLKSAAGRSADEVAGEFDGAGSEAGELFGAKFAKVFAVGGALLAVAVKFGQALGDAISDGLEAEKLSDKLQASMGLTEAGAAEFSNISKNVFRQGWGDSTGDINRVLETLVSTSKIELDSSELELATSNVLALGEAFEVDVPRAAQVAANAMNKGLAKDMTESLDLLTAGMQKVPLTLRDEFIDAVDEYGPHLVNLGLTGEEAIGLLVSATESGQYGIDKMGDAFKEFGIKIKELDADGVSVVAGELEQLGLDWSDVVDGFAAGGDDARDAMKQIMNGLKDIDDPMKQAAISTALFGAPFEDLGLTAEDFGDRIAEAGDVLGDFEGRAQDVADTLGGNTATEMENARRRFQMFRQEVGEKVLKAVKGTWSWIKDRLAPIFKWLGEKILPPVVKVFGEVRQVIQAYIMPLFQGIWKYIRQFLAPAFQLLKTTVEVVWSGMWNVIDRFWRLIKGVLDALKRLVQGDVKGAFSALLTGVKNAFTGIWDTIRSVWSDKIVPLFKGVGDTLHKWFVKPFQTAVNSIRDALDAIKNAFLAPINWVIKNVINGGFIKVINKITSALGLGNKLSPVGLVGGQQTTRDAMKGVADRMRARARAKGGYTPPGWTLVGEEGPELVNFKRPGMVYTAGQTESMLQTMSGARISPYLRPDRQYTEPEANLALSALASGDPDRLQATLGRNPDDALLPIGGFSFGAFGSWVKDKWDGITEWVTEIGGKAVKFVRGKLADGMKAVISPLQNKIRSNTSGVVSDIFVGAGDWLVNWMRGVDEGTEELTDFFSSDIGMSLAGISDKGFYRPMSGGVLTSRFGVGRYGSTHAGIDLATPVGTPVFAVKDGVVRAAGWNALTGRTGIGVVLAHAGGLGSYYGHLSGVSVSPGQTVKAGQRIASSGNTGRSTGPHLHWELSRGGNPQNVFDPLPYLTSAGTPAPLMHSLLSSRTGKPKDKRASGATLFDTGGWLQPGFTPVVNLTNKPEAILTGDQWETMRALAGQGVSGPRELVVRDVDGALVGRMKVEAEQAIMREAVWV